MNAHARPSFALALALALFGPALAGCEDKKPVAVADDAGAVSDQKSQLSGKLGAAVAALPSATPSASAAPGSGPPETGIFAPGGADAVHAPNAPPKLELLGDGAEPRVQLALAAPEEQKAYFDVAARLGPQAGLPNLDFTLSLKTDKTGKGTATVASVAPAKDFRGQLPKDFEDAIGKLKGSEIRYQLSPDGALTDVTTTLAKGADAGVEPALKALVEGMTLLSTPLPKKPIGVGAYWMVADRSASFGVDVVRYRVFKVQKIEQGKATLSVDVRQYAAKSDIDLGALAGGAKIKFERFESSGKGTAEWAANALFPQGSEVVLKMQGQFATGKPGQMGMLQTELTANTQAPAADEKSAKKK